MFPSGNRLSTLAEGSGLTEGGGDAKLMCSDREHPGLQQQLRLTGGARQSFLCNSELAPQNRPPPMRGYQRPPPPHTQRLSPERERPRGCGAGGAPLANPGAEADRLGLPRLPGWPIAHHCAIGNRYRAPSPRGLGTHAPPPGAIDWGEKKRRKSERRPKPIPAFGSVKYGATRTEPARRHALPGWRRILTNCCGTQCSDRPGSSKFG